MSGPSRVLAVLAACLAGHARAEEWKPAPAPLATRWAKDVSPRNVHPEYPRPQMVRADWLSLNGLWELAIAEPGQKPPVGRTLPGKVLVPFPIESSLSGVRRAFDRVWYRRTFEVPEAWRARRVRLNFQAVDWETTVFVNGRELGTHRGGYDAFAFDVTDALRPDGPQELIVRVFDPGDAGEQPRGKQARNPHGIWYTSTTGIWQTVWLEPVRPVHVARLDLVPDVDASCLRLTVRAPGAAGSHTVRAEVRSMGEPVVQAFGGIGAEVILAIPREQLTLWSPENPFLYDLAVQLLEDDRPVDEVAAYFGMRKIDLGRDEQGFQRVRLNGKPVFLTGALDQGFWPDGIYTAPTDEALRYDLETAKRLGFNMVRKHVKVEPQRWYYWCDRLGLLVWQDMPNGHNRSPDGRKQFELELDRMVEGLRNHPSVAAWVVFNEGWGQHDTGRLVGRVRQSDPTRLVVGASGWTDEGVGDVVDLHKYPGPAAPRPEPDRAGVLGEFGGLGLGVDGHTWAERTWGYRGTASRDELTRRYAALLRGVWALRQSHGLAGAVYTQLIDVETECNGLMTYDRAVIKADPEKVAAVNAGKGPQVAVLVPTSQQKGLTWRYTTRKPPDDWTSPGFDDSAWHQGPGGFGAKGTPGAVVRTEWNTPQIWLRREVELPQAGPGELVLLVHHGEDVEVYVNGVLAAAAPGYTTDYEELPAAPQAARALQPGRNVLAVTCKQTEGGQYVDVGVALIGGTK